MPRQAPDRRVARKPAKLLPPSNGQTAWRIVAGGVGKVCKLLDSSELTTYCIVLREITTGPRFHGVILEGWGGGHRVPSTLFRMPDGMPDRSAPARPLGSDDSANAATQDVHGASATSSAPGELPAERSRFSQWLARFGLGEIPHPLLTRRRVATRGTPGHP